MKTYLDYKVGGEGGRFVDARLNAGNSLARMVAKRYRADGNHCVARLPCDVAPEAVTKLTDGIGASLEESRRWLVSVIQAYLSSGPDRLVVLEDALARRGDRCLDRLQSASHCFRDEVYRVLTVASSGDFAITTAISETESPHQLVLVFTRSPSPRETVPTEIEVKVLEAWADLAEAVAVMAYDGEGYIFCSHLSRAGENSAIS